MVNELKPCPLCGGEARVICLTDGGHWFIKEYEVCCSRCGATMNRTYRSEFNINDTTGELVLLHDGKKEAIDEWNRRTDKWNRRTNENEK